MAGDNGDYERRLYKSVGGFWFLCEDGHRSRSDRPNMPMCMAPVHADGRLGVHAMGSDECDECRPCGADMDYRLVDYREVPEQDNGRPPEPRDA